MTMTSIKSMTPAERAANRAAMSQRTAMRESFRDKFKRRSGETKADWKARTWAAIADIHATLKLHDHDSDYAKRLYLELDEARAAYVYAIRVTR